MKSQESHKSPFVHIIVPIAFIGAVLFSFVMVHIFEDRVESSVKYFDDSFDHLEEQVDKLRHEVSELKKNFLRVQEMLRRVETLPAPHPPSAEPSEDSDANLDLDSVPCCGDNATNFDSIEPISEDVVSFQQAFEQVRANLPEDQRLQLEEMDQENEEFFNTLDEEGLAELERRKQEFKNKMRSRFTTMMAAMPEQVKQNWKKNKRLMEQSWEMAAHTTTLMDMRREYRLLPSRIGALMIKRKAAPPPTEEEWKMQEALRMLEDAARQQE